MSDRSIKNDQLQKKFDTVNSARRKLEEQHFNEFKHWEHLDLDGQDLRGEYSSKLKVVKTRKAIYKLYNKIQSYEVRCSLKFEKKQVKLFRDIQKIASAMTMDRKIGHINCLNIEFRDMLTKTIEASAFRLEALYDAYFDRMKEMDIVDFYMPDYIKFYKY